MRIYLDYAATTLIDKRVAKAMRDFETHYFGNPNSRHYEGQQARAEIDFARATIAKFINSKPQEIIFTSGATEANNLAIQGTVSFYIEHYQIKPHVITTKLEHPSIYNTVKALRDRGVIDATFIDPTVDGLVDPQEVIRAITDNTVLISLIFVSNEIGSILPIREIGQLLHDVNAKQKMPIMYHTDAVQAIKFFNCNIEKLGSDLLTLSAHKISGPKGIGALFVKTGAKISNIFFGGAQEYGIRPGTQNTPGIIGFAKAIELLGPLEERQESGKKISKLRDELISGALPIKNVILNGPAGERGAPDVVNFTIFDLDQDSLVTALDLAGVSASTGSACVSGANEPSHVIAALGKINDREAATVRFTLGKATKSSDIVYVVKILKQLIPKLRHEK